MMKGVMMSAILTVTNPPTSGAGEPAQAVASLVKASNKEYTSPYSVTVKKIEPIAASNQVRVTLLVTGEDEPAHDFSETGNQVAAEFFNAGLRANASESGGVTVQKIEALEGSDDSDESSDEDELSESAVPAGPVAAPTPPQPTSSITPEAAAGNVPTLPVPPSIGGNRPTTSDSSPIQQPGTTLGDAEGEESVNDGPSEHEERPH